MTAKELVTRFFDHQSGGWKDVPFQMNIAKSLVIKYSDEALITALDLYKDQMYSLGFLNEKNMGRAITLSKSTININYEVGGDIAERNRAKLQRLSSQPRERERYYLGMLEE